MEQSDVAGVGSMNDIIGYCARGNGARVGGADSPEDDCVAFMLCGIREAVLYDAVWRTEEDRNVAGRLAKNAFRRFNLRARLRWSDAGGVGPAVAAERMSLRKNAPQYLRVTLCLRAQHEESGMRVARF